MIDLNSKAQLSEKINFLIDRAIDAIPDEKRTYLGASYLGDPCERKVQYMYLASQGFITRPSFPARTKRIFQRGHMMESYARDLMKSAGFVFGEPTDDTQIKDHGGKFLGHEDGIIFGWDTRKGGDWCPIELPAVWEHKALSNKYWKELEKNKLKKYSDTYYGQVVVEMQYLKIPRAVFTATNVDSMEIYHEIIPQDEPHASMLKSRMSRIFTATDLGELLPRISTERSYYLCRLCPFSDTCWSKK